MKKHEIIQDALTKFGSAKSGHYGHKGIPGHRGGSAARGGGGIPSVSEDQEGMDKWWPRCTKRFGPALSLEAASFPQTGRKGSCDNNALKVFKSDPEAEVYYGTVLSLKYDGWRPIDSAHYFNMKNGRIIDTSPFTRKPGEFFYFGVKVPGVTKSTSAKKLWQLDDALDIPSWKEISSLGEWAPKLEEIK